MSDCALSFFSFPCFIAFFISHAKQRLVIGYRLHLFFVSGMTGSLIGFCMLRYILQVQCDLGLEWSKFNVDKYSTSRHLK